MRRPSQARCPQLSRMPNRPRVPDMLDDYDYHLLDDRDDDGSDYDDCHPDLDDDYARHIDGLAIGDDDPAELKRAKYAGIELTCRLKHKLEGEEIRRRRQMEAAENC